MEQCHALTLLPLVLAEEPCCEEQAALGTTATWWHASELQAWWP